MTSSRIPRQSRLSADKRDNEIIAGAVCRYPGIYLTAEGNPVKSQLGDHLMKVVRPEGTQYSDCLQRSGALTKAT
jgi:hypothetical protein